ncbi:MAG: RagB/SusD family nutrient uptake outer membrane protein, partial [Tannerella sp.]|nr:RagB/SusD family nutrient uptake outer membrane protein [Tannerella sp.]
MKKQTKIIILSMLSFYVLFSTACFDLETEVYNKISPDIYPQTAQEADALVMSNVYNLFNSSWHIFNAAWGWQVLSFISTDEVETNWGNKGQYVGFENTGSGGYPITDESRTPPYHQITFLSKMRLTLDRIKDVPMTENEKNVMNAQIHCGMGFLGFLLYDLYGPVPLAPLEVLQRPLDNEYVPRATEEEMQEYIESNLLEAAKYLPYKWDDSEYGRFTKGLANMVLFKYYMLMGGRMKNEGQSQLAGEYWDKAEKTGRELMKPEYGYELVPNYHSLFTLAGEKNTEAIYSSTARIDGGMGHTWLAHVLPSDYPTPGNITRWGVFHLSWYFFDTFEKNDKRLEKIADTYVGETGTIHGRTDKEGGLQYGPAPVKYGLEGTVGTMCEIDLVVFRYADVMTLLAEAIVRNNGGAVTAEALDLLNKVRTRVGLTPYSLKDAGNATNFLNLLLAERGHELYMEGSRRQ